MGFFDSLFGGGKKAEAPKSKPKKVKAPAESVQLSAEPVAAEGLTPEVVAAISASIGMMMEDASAEMIAAVTAAIVHSRGGAMAVRIKRTGNSWAASGRQKIMDSRQMM